MATTGASKPAGTGAASLTSEHSSMSQEKIKQMMNQDPKFIGRLIEQLDKQMHSVVLEKQRRSAQIEVDLKEMATLDTLIQSNIQPNLDRVNESVRTKTAMRDDLRKQLADQSKQLHSMEHEAAALLQNARSMTTKLLRNTASQRLEEARGFSSTVPTSTLLRSKKPASTAGTAASS